MTFRRTSRKRGAFTLIELLVALAVIAVLLVIATSVTLNAVARSKSTTCQSNLRQLGQATALYLSDFDGRYPIVADGYTEGGQRTASATTWSEVLLPYLKTFPVCPSRELPGDLARYSDASTCGYAINDNLRRARASVPASKGEDLAPNGDSLGEVQIRYPAATVVFCDARIVLVSVVAPDFGNQWEMGSLYVPDQDHLLRAQRDGALRHGGRGNYLFADGHIKALLPREVSARPAGDGKAGFGL
jgi:prepilin-type processing-associated H-X9-DG protein/prepilin-type N-terminal cleavage/methylation domain-containing protein